MSTEFCRIGAELEVLRYHWDEVYSIWHDAAAQDYRALSKMLPAGDVLSAPTADGLRRLIWRDYTARTLGLGRVIPRRWWRR